MSNLEILLVVISFALSIGLLLYWFYYEDIKSKLENSETRINSTLDDLKKKNKEIHELRKSQWLLIARPKEPTFGEYYFFDNKVLYKVEALFSKGNTVLYGPHQYIIKLYTFDGKFVRNLFHTKALSELIDANAIQKILQDLNKEFSNTSISDSNSDYLVENERFDIILNQMEWDEAMPANAIYYRAKSQIHDVKFPQFKKLLAEMVKQKLIVHKWKSYYMKPIIL